MKKSKVIRLIVQAVAVGFGILGLIDIYLGLYFMVTSIRDSDLFGMFFMTPICFLFGGIVIAVAWQNLHHFGPNAIQNIVALVAFLAYAGLLVLLEPFEKYTHNSKTVLDDIATVFGPILLAYMLYRVLSRKLIQITETQNTPKHELEVPLEDALNTDSDTR